MKAWGLGTSLVLMTVVLSSLLLASARRDFMLQAELHALHTPVALRAYLTEIICVILCLPHWPVNPSGKE